ncbi:hypothetical protein AVEN_179174-1 [Araneus ventricosus]|uniref:Tc3 transposase DNA binding domain-containing protein n=1 Tax=Araneus ventricosus TaxID=182803 RepID=A0A4Y2C7B0_ARAVE|nr:hypothetical protein AVEN_179174-1 [Araneus ventricosus]
MRLQITGVCNQSSQPDAVGNAYIRQQMSDKCTRSVPAAAMAGYQDLSDFEHGVITGAREMGHSISEVAMKFGFSRTTISRVYLEYQVSGKTSNFRHRCGRKKTLKEMGHGRESLNEIDLQHFLILPWISIMGHVIWFIL